jgi:hypothetical protein
VHGEHLAHAPQRQLGIAQQAGAVGESEEF